MRIRRQSIITGNITEQDIPCTEEQLFQWTNGMLIQDAMPNLTMEQREFIMTGVTPEEWEEHIEEEDEDA